MRLPITIAMLEIRTRETLQSKVNICKSDVKIGDYADSLISPRPYCRSRRGRNGLGSETNPVTGTTEQAVHVMNIDKHVISVNPVTDITKLTSARPEVRGTADVGWQSLFSLPFNPLRTHSRLYHHMCLRTDGQ